MDDRDLASHTAKNVSFAAKQNSRKSRCDKGITRRLPAKGTRNSNVKIWTYLFLIVLLVTKWLGLRSVSSSEIMSEISHGPLDKLT